MKEKRGDKRGVVADYLPWIILAIVVLSVVMISIFVMRSKGFSLIDQLKGLFRGG
jgi:hypothetical protein